MQSKKGLPRSKYFVFCLTLWVTAGCNAELEHHARPGNLRDWENQILGKSPSGSNPYERAVAQNAQVCLKDRMSASYLSSEIGAQEQAIGASGSPSISLSGAFSGFQGSAAAKQYISKFQGNAIYTGSQVSYSGCSGIPCVINRIYGVSDTSLIGLEVYWFWLKTGYGLSTSRVVPRIADVPSASLQSYLFKKEEVDAFWRISHMLPSPFFRRASLQTIHRLPVGYNFGMGNTCGIASGSRISGDVRLSDNCLTLTPTVLMNPNDFFYGAVTHEVTHRVDFLLGESGTDSYSDRAVWLGFSGWSLQRVVKPSGGYEDQWSSDPSKEKFVRDYAGTSPAEDFAESAAYYRFRPQDLKRLAPGKSSHLRNLLFEGREYEPQALLLFYRQAVEQKLRLEMAGLLKACFIPVTPGDAASIEAESISVQDTRVEEEFLKSFMLPEKVGKCLARSIYDTMKKEFDRLRFEEWEACDLLSESTERGQRSSVLTMVKEDFSRDLAGIEEMAPILLAQKELREAIEQELDPREAAMYCAYSPEASKDLEEIKKCFTRLVTSRFEETGATYAERMGVDRYQLERDAYLVTHTFDRSLGRVHELYDLLFGKIHGFVRKKGQGLWSECVGSAPTEEGSLRDSPEEARIRPYRITGGSHYVDSSLLRCLNSGLDPLLDQMVLATLSRLGLGDPSPAARSLMVSRYLEAPILEVIEQNIRIAAEKEEAEILSLFESFARDYRLKVLADLSWLKLEDSLEGRVASCQVAHWGSYEVEGGSLVAGKVWRFATPAKALESSLEVLCRSALEAPQAVAHVRALQESFDSTQFLRLEEQVAMSAKPSANSCRGKYVGTSSSVKSKRKSCLERSWSGILGESVREWMRRPESLEVSGNPQTRGAAYLRSKSSDLFKKAVEAMEKGVQN